VKRMTFLDFRTALDSVGGLRSVHHNVAKLKAAREIARRTVGLPSLKSEAWPPNVASIAEARARRQMERRGGL
jgi:hypothetical protein